MDPPFEHAAALRMFKRTGSRQVEACACAGQAASAAGALQATEQGEHSVYSWLTSNTFSIMYSFLVELVLRVVEHDDQSHTGSLRGIKAMSDVTSALLLVLSSFTGTSGVICKRVGGILSISIPLKYRPANLSSTCVC